MNYYDVVYKSPVGNIGTHIAVECETAEKAKTLSPWLLSINTPWEPEEFTVISVEESKTPPLQPQLSHKETSR
jgi:hypothetical protein